MSEKVEFTPIKVDEDATLNPQEVNKSQRRRKTIIATIVVAVIVLVIVAFVVGYLGERASQAARNKKNIATNRKLEIWNRSTRKQ